MAASATTLGPAAWMMLVVLKLRARRPGARTAGRRPSSPAPSSGPRLAHAMGSWRVVHVAAVGFDPRLDGFKIAAVRFDVTERRGDEARPHVHGRACHRGEIADRIVTHVGQSAARRGRQARTAGGTPGRTCPPPVESTAVHKEEWGAVPSRPRVPWLERQSTNRDSVVLLSVGVAIPL
jgi:hypothetical protein